jgi:SNF2 family DNA or RNA helicase
VKRNHITIRDNMFRIEVKPHIAIRLRRFFGGAQRYQAGLFQIAATPQHAYELRAFGTMYPIEFDDVARAKYEDLIAVYERRLASIAAIERAEYVPRDFALALPPREYQRIAADIALQSGGLLIADDLGAGKTVSAICTFTAPGTLPAAVVTMTHLQRQWIRELARFAPSLRVHQIRSTQPYDFNEVKLERDPLTGRRKVVRARGVPDVLVMNYQKLDGWCETLAGITRTIVYDEAQELRRSESKKYEAASKISQAVDLRVGLTATPIYNYGIEIFNVMNAIAPDQLGTRKEFLDEWCGGESGMKSADDKARVEDPAALGTYLRESGLMIRRTRKDINREIPPVTIVRHIVEADPESIQRATADVAELAKRILDRIGAPADRMRNAGELDYRMRQATGIAKAGAVAEFVRLLVSAGERVVLFGWHHGVYRLWQSAFDTQGSEVSYALYTGKESEAQKETARQRFIDGDAQVLMMSLRAGAGIDGLQFVSRTVVFGELDWSPGVHWQDIGRVARDGQTDPVMAYYLVAEEGSDPVVADTLGLKEAQAAGIRDPQSVGEPVHAGAADDHIRRLAEDVLRRRKAA